METHASRWKPTNKRFFRIEKDADKILSDVTTEVFPTTEDFVSKNAFALL